VNSKNQKETIKQEKNKKGKKIVNRNKERQWEKKEVYDAWKERMAGRREYKERTDRE
jgi:hypothetical protein